MKYFWRKPAKTLIYLLTLFMMVGFFSVPVHATGEETQGTEGENTATETVPENTEGEKEGAKDGEQGQTGTGSLASITPYLQENTYDDLAEYIEKHEDSLVVDMYEVASFDEIKFTVSKDGSGKEVFDLTGYDLNKDFLLKIKEEGGQETDNFSEMIAKWDKLAQNLAGQVKTSCESETGTAITPTASKKLTEKAEHLEPGLYLILAHGKDLTGKNQFETVEVEPSGSSTTPTTILTTVMNTEMHTYNFRPVLIVVPSKSADANQKKSTDPEMHIATSDAGKWVYNVNVYLKPSEKPLYGNLKIIKEVQVLEDRINDGKVTPMTAVFKITGYDKAGKKVYKNVASIIVPQEKQYVILEHIPVGTRIEVEESYSGSGYKKVSGPTCEDDPIIIKKPTSPDADPAIDSQTVTVTFVDTYDDELKKGYGIMNNFTKTGENTWHVKNDIGGEWNLGGGTGDDKR